MSKQLKQPLTGVPDAIKTRSRLRRTSKTLALDQSRQIQGNYLNLFSLTN